jgi:hypothetical protein
MIRIKKTPKEREIDGVSLTDLVPGSVRNVSSTLGSWLITEEYAEPEMRQSRSTDDDFESAFDPTHLFTPIERRRQKR